MRKYLFLAVALAVGVTVVVGNTLTQQGENNKAPEGTIPQKRSAASISAEVAAAKCEPSEVASATTFAIAGCPCP